MNSKHDCVTKFVVRLSEVFKNASIADIMKKEYPSREEQFGASLGTKLMSRHVANGDLYKKHPVPTKQQAITFLV